MSLFRILLVIFYFGLALFIWFLNQMNEFPNVFIISNNKTLPLILMSTPIFGSKPINNFILNALKICDFKCKISDDFSLYSNADIAVFHARDMEINEVLRTNKNPKRLNVFYSMEAYPYANIRKTGFPMDFFNLSMSFRRESIVWTLYGKFENIELQDDKDLIWSEEQVTNALMKKTQLVVQFVSHCQTHSVREKYVEKLGKFVNISRYGSCFNNKIENQDKIIAFENAVCKDYVTEKFWRLGHLIVPIVLKRDILKGIVDDQYFIAADDFDTPQALAERLIYLSENRVEYKQYLGWTQIYRKVQAYDGREYCNLCKLAYKNEKHSIKDIYQWWEEEAQCHFNYSTEYL